MMDPWTRAAGALGSHQAKDDQSSDVPPVRKQLTAERRGQYCQEMTIYMQKKTQEGQWPLQDFVTVAVAPNDRVGDIRDKTVECGAINADDSLYSAGEN